MKKTLLALSLLASAYSFANTGSCECPVKVTTCEECPVLAQFLAENADLPRIELLAKLRKQLDECVAEGRLTTEQADEFYNAFVNQLDARAIVEYLLVQNAE